MPSRILGTTASAKYTYLLAFGNKCRSNHMHVGTHASSSASSQLRLQHHVNIVIRSVLSVVLRIVFSIVFSIVFRTVCQRQLIIVSNISIATAAALAHRINSTTFASTRSHFGPNSDEAFVGKP